MPVINLWADPPGSDLLVTEFDVCVVGTGPAGSTIAKELADTNLTVAIVESGDFERRSEVDKLNDIESVGWPRAVDQWSVRNRIVGGSSYTWGGRCAPFDEIDFEERDWIPMSGWPLDFATLQPYLDRSADYLGLIIGDGFQNGAFWKAQRETKAISFDSEWLLPFYWQYSRDHSPRYPFEYKRFGRHLNKHLGPNQTLIVGATLRQIKINEDASAVNSILFMTPSGDDLLLRTKNVVLCAGGIENARILLNSNDVDPQGLGNDRDLVGRYLMDHIRGPVGHFDLAAAPQVLGRLGRFNLRGNLFSPGMRLSPSLQKQERLLNCAAWVGEEVSDDDPWNALRSIIRLNWPSLLPDSLTVVKNSRYLAKGIYSQLASNNGFPRKLDRLTLVAMIEQLPNCDSRVTLSDQRDRFGCRLPKVDWRTHAEEARSMRRIAEIALECFREMGLPELTLEDWVAEKRMFPDTFVDVAHPSGTTRMSTDPAKGVVDENCKVHGIEGLYVAGSSVFPTVGHCNPTQLIVALSIRLADTLRTYLARMNWVNSARKQPIKPKVLLTGARGRLGSAVLPNLIKHGYEVRAVTSKDLPVDHLAGPFIEWKQFDLASVDGYGELVAGCSAVVHLAAEIGKMEVMDQINARATGLIAKAAEGANISAFCYVSTVSVYGSSIAQEVLESGPLLTFERDVKSEYWALPYVRAYGRTKLAGELELRRSAEQTHYVILRPTRIVSVDEIIEIREWSILKRWLAAHRNAQHIFNEDVADAIIWALDRALSDGRKSGEVEEFNLSDCDFAGCTHRDFIDKAYLITGDRRFRAYAIPSIIDWAQDFVKYGHFPLRRPLWSMRFPNNKIRRAGYSLKFGMAHAHALALARLRREHKSMR